MVLENFVWFLSYVVEPIEFLRKKNFKNNLQAFSFFVLDEQDGAQIQNAPGVVQSPHTLQILLILANFASKNSFLLRKTQENTPAQLSVKRMLQNLFG